MSNDVRFVNLINKLLVFVLIVGVLIANRFFRGNTYLGVDIRVWDALFAIHVFLYLLTMWMRAKSKQVGNHSFLILCDLMVSLIVIFTMALYNDTNGSQWAIKAIGAGWVCWGLMYLVVLKQWGYSQLALFSVVKNDGIVIADVRAGGNIVVSGGNVRMEDVQSDGSITVTSSNIKIGGDIREHDELLGGDTDDFLENW